MKYCYHWIFCLLGLLLLPLGIVAQGQFQGFEGMAGDNWNYTVNPPAYNADNGEDVWDDTTATGLIDPASGDFFWFMRDLENDNGGTADFHTIDFDLIDISGFSFNALSFKYNTFEFEASDSIGYLLYFDDGTNYDIADFVALDGNTGGWQTELINIPPGSQFVRFRLMAKQNGASDYAGFDDIQLQSSTTDVFPPVVQEVEVLSNAGIQVTFSEPMGPAAFDFANYTGIPGLQDIVPTVDNDQFILVFNTPFPNGQPLTLTIQDVDDLAGNTLVEPFTFTFIYNELVPALVITEIMYNDTSNNDNLEFIEIYNNSTATVPLGGLRIEGEIDYEFPVMDLPGEGIFLLARESNIADAFYGVTFNDWGTGGLGNGGASLVILNTVNEVIDLVDYDDTAPWPLDADGVGPSLELISFNLDNSLGQNWQANTTQVGTTAIFANPGTVTNLTTPVIGFTEALTQVNESAGTISLELEITNSGDLPATATVAVSSASTAVAGVDFEYATTSYVFPANATENIQVEVEILTDIINDGGKYLILEITDLVDAEAGSITRQTVLINDEEYLAPAPVVTPTVALQHLISVPSGGAGSTAEIVDYDPATQRLYVSNSEQNTVEILDFSNPSAPFTFFTIDLNPFGDGVNSVAVKDGVVAVAMQAPAANLNGTVVFFTPNGSFINAVTVGVLPDMLTFTQDGTKILVANEGEPADNYLSDAEGSISVIDITPGVENINDDNVTNLDFTAFNDDLASLAAAGVRIFGPGATVAQDLEPEFITVSSDGTTAYATLQENNALAVIDLVNLEITSIEALGYKDHSLIENSLDPSNDAPDIFFSTWNIKGMYQPDAIASFNIGGVEYLITANEGDARDYDGFSEEIRFGDEDYVLDPMVFPNAATLKQDELLGRLNLTTANGDTDGDGDYDEVYAYGGRSFSIWNAADGSLVYDSGDDLEQITANDPVFGAIFNASNSNDSFKNRSDDKGPEPEGVTVAEINGRWYAMIGLERIGGIMLYDISDPTAPIFLQYINTRTVGGSDPGGDLAPEGLRHISADESPDGEHYLVVANEESGTIGVFRLGIPARVGFAEEVIAVEEDANIAEITLNITEAGDIDGVLNLEAISASTAVEGEDFNFVESSILIPAGVTGTQVFELEILDDADETGGRYLILGAAASSTVLPDDEEELIVLIKDNDIQAPAPQPEAYVQLNYLNSLPIDTLGVAEIVAYDATSQRIFVTNSEANQLHIVDISDPTVYAPVSEVDLSVYGGGVNSVAVNDGVVAVAIQAEEVDGNGQVVFLDTDGAFINSVEVGVLPDMLVFTPDNSKVLTANEGEPSDEYDLDPEGSVSVIDLTPGVANLTQVDVTTLTFEAFNDDLAALVDAGVRIFGPGATVAQDLEPEYIVVDDLSAFAFVFCQENNAIALVDLAALEVVDILPLGTKDYSLTENTFDASDRSPDVFFANWPVQGYYHPDGATYVNIGGNGYLLTANEGDARDYDGYSEEARVKDDEYPLDPTVFPDADYLKNDNLLGRLKVTLANGDTDGDGDYDEIRVYGGRSFSIWDAATATLLWDSGDQFERVIEADPVYGQIFNADEDENEAKGRSDDKGPEPEAVIGLEVDERDFAVIGLERIGGLMLYDINDPVQPEFLQYINTRGADGDEPTGDLSPEGIIHIPFDQSPNGNHLIVVSNEVSGTVSIYEVGVNCSIELGQDLVICDGGSATLVADAGFASYTWSTGSEEPSIEVNLTDTYVVTGTTTSGCMASDTIEVIVNPLPIVDLGADTTICVDQTLTLDAGNWDSYQWSDGSMDATLEVMEEGTFSVTVTDEFGCEGSDEIMVTVEICPGVFEAIVAGELQALPNPVVDRVQLSLSDFEAGEYTLRIEDALGKTWQTQGFTMQGSEQQLELDLRALPAGTYFLSLQTSKGSSQGLQLIKL